VTQGARTIVFMKSRKAVELIARFATLALEDAGNGHLAERVAPYRAGYTAQQRRELERRLVDGELLGVISTDALELGIDIGSLDAAICVTFPGTVASLRQMWGRAGRRGRGLAVYVAGEDALDQFFCRHPDEFLDRPVEAAILDPFNEQIHAGHVLCAAHEGPLEPADAEWLGDPLELTAERLEAAGELRRRPGGTFVPRHAGEYPAGAVSLRSTGRDGFAIVDVGSGELLGTVDAGRAFNTTHEGAVYLHGGRAFEVSELDLESRRALVRPFEGDWYTQAKRETDMYIERLEDRREWLGVRLSFGSVVVTEQVVAYQTRRLSDHEVLDLVGLDLPQTSFATKALWYELPQEIVSLDLPLDRLLGALHAAEHSQIAVLPLLAMCDRWDIGGLSTNLHPQTGGPAIFIYDGHPGGIGITRRGFLAFDALVDDAHRLVSECPCEKGCPSCVQSPKCGNLNEPLSKDGAAQLMGRMLAFERS
jgi:DEAD/DEAH box helicase domain-containing protein